MPRVNSVLKPTTPARKPSKKRGRPRTKGPLIRVGDYVHTLAAPETVRQVVSVYDGTARLAGGGVVKIDKLVLCGGPSPTPPVASAAPAVPASTPTTTRPLPARPAPATAPKAPPAAVPGPKPTGAAAPPQVPAPTANGKPSPEAPTAMVCQQHPNGLVSWVQIRNGTVAHYLCEKVTPVVFTLTKLGYHTKNVYNVFIGKHLHCGCEDYRRRGGHEHQCKHIKALRALAANSKI
jgi:hypothetical protein